MEMSIKEAQTETAQPVMIGAAAFIFSGTSLRSRT